MNSALNLSRNATAALLLSSSLAVGLHSSHMALWMWGLWALAVAWRIGIHVGRLGYPNAWLKALAVGCASLGVAFSAGFKFSLEMTASFLLAAALLKLLEMKSTRDGLWVLWLSYFVLGVGFLFDQSLWTALYAALVIWLQTTTWVLLQSRTVHANVRNGAKLSLALLALALPLMVVLYLFFPRLSPLWAISLHSSQAKTGLSSEMTLGDITALGQSDELVFRASFNEGLPARNTLYWRALVLDEYDGKRWQSRTLPEVQWFDPSQPLPESSYLEYDIIQEAQGERWVYGLTHAYPLEPGLGVTDDDRLVPRRPVQSRLRYRARSYAEPWWLQDHRTLNAGEYQRYTALPKGYNPQTIEWAQSTRAQHGSDQAWLKWVLTYFQQQPFYYSLTPPAMGQNEVDAFLFTERRGFCAHYAGALVVILRAAGVPARMVTGYQGGEWHQSEHYLTVRQYDAHAWVDLWLPDQGWISVDPTAVVAPDRIEFGLQRAVADEGSFLQSRPFSSHRYQHIAWLNQLRLQLDSLNYYWQRWVLSYDRERQRSLWRDWFQIHSVQNALQWLISLFLGVMALVALLMLIRKPMQHVAPWYRDWQRLQRVGQTFGVMANNSESPMQYLARLNAQWPEPKSELIELSQHLEQALYGDGQGMETLPQRIKQSIRVLKRNR